VADRKAFLLRADPALLEALQRWANDDLRSLNAQIEFVLRRSLKEAERLDASPGTDPAGGATGPNRAAEGGHPQG
jgi:hypothetical protein